MCFWSEGGKSNDFKSSGCRMSGFGVKGDFFKFGEVQGGNIDFSLNIMLHSSTMCSRKKGFVITICVSCKGTRRACNIFDRTIL